MSAQLPWGLGNQGVIERPRPSPVLLFYSYAPEDESLYRELDKHLHPLHRNVAFWHAGMAIAGSDLPRQTAKYLDEATLIILLISHNYLSSDSLFNGELKRAMERHTSAGARVIPVIVRHCDWTSEPFGALTPLPDGGNPVSAWPDRDEAWTDVAKGIRRALAEDQKFE